MKLQFVFFLFCVIAFCASLSFVALSGPSIGIAVPTTYPASGWGDFNRDGYLDLAVCGSGSANTTGVYLNNRNETFTVIPGVTLILVTIVLFRLATSTMTIGLTSFTTMAQQLFLLIIKTTPLSH